jgi:hemerythrin superfamily protein
VPCLLLLQRQLLALQLLREMTVHTLAEETVVYPVVAEEVGTARFDTVCMHLDSASSFAVPSVWSYDKLERQDCL